MFWSISDQYNYLACRLHVQIRLMGNFGLNGAMPWITNCFVCKRDTESLGHFLFDCPDFREHFDSLWSNLCLKVTANNPLDGRHIVGYIMTLDRHHKAMLLLGCLPLPFYSSTVTVIIRLITSAIGKRACEANPVGENSSFIFKIRVKSVPLYYFKLACVVCV